MNRRPHSAPHRESAAAASRGEAQAALAEFLEEQYRLIVTSAISGGLGKARKRSSADRVSREARRFVRLLSLAIKPSDRGLTRRTLHEEVRFGSLASADFEELRDVFAVWRRTTEAFMAATARSESNHLIGHALDELERSAREEIGRWASNRVDLIAIGASAGGIPALSDLLTRLSADVPATILVVLHLSARTPSLVPAILARNCSLVVTPAVDGAALYLGHVYVAVPGRHLIVTDGRINLMDGLAVHFVKPSVDVLFESAAEVFGPHLVSAVLSGTGADGSTGTRAVHERRGITLAQDPASAEFRGMPEAAIATGAVDRIGAVPQLAAALQRLTTEGRGELGL